MRAAVCGSLGPPEVVTVEDVPDPALDSGQVRIAVAHAAVNFPDVLMVAGEYQIKVPPPFVPGSELAGVVIEVAPDVETPRVGNRVTATLLVGAFAEQAVAPATSVRLVPDGVDLPVAAAFGVAHRTANHVLRSVAHLQAGEVLVVLGAGGGVGLAAVQLGALLGAEVVAVASSAEKLAAAAACGATHLVDHRGEDLRASLRTAFPQGVAVAVDPVGGDLAEPALRSLRWGGRFVTVGYASGTIPAIPLNLVLLKGVHVLGFEFLGFATNAPDELRRNDDELDVLLASGQIRPHIGATYPLEDTAAALALVGRGAAIGKILIDVGAEADGQS